MKTIKEKLKEAETIKEKAIKENGGYGMKETPHIPEILEYLKQFREEKSRGEEQTVYNEELKEYIAEKENIPEELKRILGTEVFFAQSDYRNELKERKRKEMIKNGYLELTKDIEYRGKIELVAKYAGSWATNNIKEVCRLITSGDGYPFIIAKGKRSRGWYVNNLEEAYYKQLS